MTIEPRLHARTEVMGVKQLGYSYYELTTSKKLTRSEKFLAEMEAVVPSTALIALMEQLYSKASKKGGRPAYLPDALVVPRSGIYAWKSP